MHIPYSIHLWYNYKYKFRYYLVLAYLGQEVKTCIKPKWTYKDSLFRSIFNSP